MKFAISNIAWKNNEDEAVLKYLSEQNISNLEVAPGRLSENIFELNEKELTSILTKYKKLGFSLVSMQSLLFGAKDAHLFENKTYRDNLKKTLFKTIDMASTLKIGNLVFGSPKNRNLINLTLLEAENIAIPFFNELGDYAQEKGTIFSLEPNAKEYGTDFLTNTISTTNFIKKINNKGIGLNLDLSTAQLNKEEPKFILNKCFDYINHIHISDPFLAPISKNMDFHQKFSKSIKEYSYQKHLSIEMKPTSEELNIQNVKDSISFINLVYR